MPFLGNQPSVGYSSIVKDDFTGNGSDTAFTLSKSVASANDIAVFVGNVRQEPTDAYTVNGTTLTMSAPPSSSDNFYVLHLASAITSSTVPATGTITSGMLTSGSVTSAKLDTNIAVAGNLTVDTNTLYVDATNNRVGIGVVSDGAKLKVVSDNGQIGLQTNAGDGSSLYIGASGSNYFDSSSSGSNIFRTSSTERMRIDSSGNVGINNNSPAISPYVSLNVKGGASSGIVTAQSSDSGSSVAIYSGNDSSDHPAILYQRDLRIGSTTGLGTTGYTERMRIDSSGRVTKPYQPSFRAYRTTTWTTTNAVITGWSTWHNIGNHFNGTTGVFTAPVAGVYQVSFHWLSNSDSTQNDVHIRLNNSQNNGIRTRNASSGAHETTSGSQSIKMNANDTLDFFLESGNMVYSDASQTWTSWSVTLLG